MKDKLLASLRLKYPKTQTAFLERVAETMASTTTDENIETVVASEGISNLLTFFKSETDRRATEGVQAYEANHKIKNGKPVVTPESDEPKDDPTMPAWAKKILDANQNLEAKLLSLEKGTASTGLLKSVEAKLLEKKIPLTFLKGRTIEKEEDVDALVAQIETDYTEVRQELINQGVKIDIPASGSGGGSTASIDADIKAWAEKK